MCVNHSCPSPLSSTQQSHEEPSGESQPLRKKGWQVQRHRIIRIERRDLWMQFCSRIWELTKAYELFLWILKVTVKSKVYISDSLRNQLCISFSNWQSKKEKKACCWGSFRLRVNELLVMISCMAIKPLGTKNNWQSQDSQCSYLLNPSWQIELQMSDEKKIECKKKQIWSIHSMVKFAIERLPYWSTEEKIILFPWWTKANDLI